MNKYKNHILGFSALLALIGGSLGFIEPQRESVGATTLMPHSGGTGTSSTIASNIGKYLKVSNNSPLTYTFDSPAGGGSASNETKWATSSTAITPNGGSAVGIIALASSTIQVANLGSVKIPSLTLGALAVDSTGSVYKHATTTFSTGLTWSGGAVTCNTASGSVFGCLSSTDWTTFNDKAPNSIFTHYASTFATTTTALSLPNSGMIGFMGNSAVTTSNYSLLGNTTLTLLNARSGGSIGFRINNTDVANFNTSGGYGFGSTYYNINAGQNNMIVEGILGVGVSAPTYNLDVAGLGHFTGLVDASKFTATSSTLASSFPQFTFTNATGTSLMLSASSTAQNFNSASSTIGTLLVTGNATGTNAHFSTSILSALGNFTTSVISTLDLLATGVRLTASDGVLTFLGLGNGADENLTLDLDNGTANTATFGSGTGVTEIKWGALGLSSLASSTFQNFNSASSTIGVELITGTSTNTGNTVLSGLSYNVSSSTASASQTVDWTSTTEWYYTMNQNTTFVLNSTSSRPLAGGRYILNICQDGVGSRTVTFQPQNAFNWTLPTGAGATTTFATTANTCSKIGFFYNGTYSKYNAIASSTSMVNK